MSKNENGNEMEVGRYTNQSLGDGIGPMSNNGTLEQMDYDSFMERSLGGMALGSAIENGECDGVGSDEVYGQIDQGNQTNQAPDMMPQHGHDRLPSISQIQQEEPPPPRPTYVRAPSSHIPESIAPPLTPEEARTEVLRRLGKATSAIKTLKRRNSNESLSSLISYSIRRPNIPSRSSTPHSLAALAHVLEDVSSSGDLSLVTATLALGADPNFRSVNRLKNRRHDALLKATLGGHVEVVDYLLRRGARYDMESASKPDAFGAMDYVLLDAAYAGHISVARYLIVNQGAKPLTCQWPRAHADAHRTIYRRVSPAHVSQRSVLHALSRHFADGDALVLLRTITQSPDFDEAKMCWSVYTDTPYTPSTPRMAQTTSHYSALSLVVKVGWFDAVALLLSRHTSSLEMYEKNHESSSEEGQIPSSNTTQWIWPAHALTRDTYLTRPHDAVRILKMLVDRGFDVSSTQHTPEDSAARSPLCRALLANAHEAVSVLTDAYPELGERDVAFRIKTVGGEEKEYVAKPLAASILLGNPDCARVLLENGANVHVPAFGYPNTLAFAAATGASSILPDLLARAPDTSNHALHVAIQKFRVDAVAVFLKHIAPLDTAARNTLWDTALGCKDTSRNDDVKRRYVRILEMVYHTTGMTRPSEQALRSADGAGNSIGVEQCIGWGLVGVSKV